ncbi:MAG: hypothetical protein KatS3mg005_3678 [Bryobacteraceae bacterium]|nr:MAG: hypothetical protein KatS3mg005_3678 [Bryobacteraceae bacterium]
MGHPAAAQTDANFHGWLQYFGNHGLGRSKAAVHLEAQVRRHDLARSWQNVLLRPALQWRLHPKFDVTAGYGFISHHRYGDWPIRRAWNEHRIFQDARLHHAAGRIRLLHRFRFENRWLENRQFENRFRYMARATVPLRGPYSLALWNEVFLPVKPERFPGVLDQNRASVLLGKRLSDHVRVEAGYMLQTVWQRNGRVREDNHTLVFAISSTLPFFSGR